jgi:hypothetical protein
MTQAQAINMRALVNELRETTKLQGRSALRQKSPVGDRFCCLGIACDMYTNVSDLRWESTDFAEYMILGWTGVLPQPVMRYFGFADQDGRLDQLPRTRIDESMTCILLNDHARLTFKQIADVLEWYYFGSEA